MFSLARLPGRVFRLTLVSLTVGGIVFLLFPLLVIVGSSIGTDPFLRFPPTGFTFTWFKKMLTLEQFIRPLWVSLQLGVIVTLLSGACGTLAALALTRGRLFGRSVIDGAFLAPLMVPTVVTGMSLMVFFNVLGFTNVMLTLVIGHVIVTMPFVVRTMTAVFHRFDRSLEEAAMTLGARRPMVLARIVLPLVTPGLFAGMVFAFVMSFDEFVLAIFLAKGQYTTFPVELFQYMRFSINPTVAAISTVLIFMTALFTWAFHKLVGLELLFGLKSTQDLRPKKRFWRANATPQSRMQDTR